MRCLLLLFLLATTTAPAADADFRGLATLRWQSGETLPGELIGGTAEEALWRSPLFEEPLRLRWTAVHRVDKDAPGTSSPDPFSVRLRDGSHLFGDLLAISDQALTLRSSRHGEVTLPRTQILSVRRTEGPRGLRAGPAGDVGWKVRPVSQEQTTSMTTERPATSVAMIRSGAGGVLVFPFGNVSALSVQTIPQNLTMELRVRSGAARPDFQLSIYAASDTQPPPELHSGEFRPVGIPDLAARGGNEPFMQMLRIETWGEDLVLVAEREFRLIRKIAEAEREVALQVTWNRKSHLCSVYDEAGVKLVTWELPATKTSGVEGILLLNKGRQLSLESLRLQERGTTPATLADPTRPRLELSDGQRLTGEVSSLVDGMVRMQVTGEGGMREVPLANIGELIFATSQPVPPVGKPVWVFSDSTYLIGDIRKIEGERAVVQTAFADALPVTLAGLRQLALPASSWPDPPAKLDELTLGENVLHGRMATTADSTVHWLPMGGLAPVTPRAGQPYSLSRQAAFPKTAGEALFYTRTGDILPARLEGVSEEEVELSSELFEMKKLPSSLLSAIQFSGMATARWQGFDDPGWRVVKGDENSLTRTKELVTLQPGSALEHPAVLQSREIKFTMAADGLSALRVALFSAGKEIGKATRLLLISLSGQITAAQEAGDGEVLNQTQKSVPQGPVSVRLVVLEKAVQLYINDALLQRFPLEANRSGGSLLLEPASMWGNPAQPVTLQDFSAESAPGSAWLPPVAEDVRHQVMTIPRFRKQDVPRQLLLAMNGDVLRGEIEAATSTSFGFRSGLENFRVERSRVQAAIWLPKPGGTAPLEVEKDPWTKILERQLPRQMRFRWVALATLVSLLQQETAQVVFTVPKELSTRSAALEVTDQTVREVLDQFCEAAKIGYTLGDKNTIVFVDKPQAVLSSSGLITRAYWLKTAFFDRADKVKEALEGRGFVLAEDTRITWLPEARQLTLTGTAEQHDKLLATLISEPGEAPSVPTHWLLLANGARLGLAVDRFEEDFVLAHHPLYGKCRVPLAQIYRITSQAPELTATTKMVEGWRLAYAPEPVLPGAPGQDSPGVGKIAKPVKLALLGGGNFDLAQEAGKVVVLDFWATWCGPCVKSLPALLEAVGGFNPEQVEFVGVNQAEPPDQIKRFMEARNWRFNVALDAGQSVAQAYGVDGIPHTVIVGPDGKVAWVHTGYSSEGAAEAAAVIKELLTAKAPETRAAEAKAPQ